MSKLLTFAFLFFVLVTCVKSSFTQIRTVQGSSAPQVKPTPQSGSPSETFFSEGMKCGKEDYDCQISNFTKAINLALNTKAVFRGRGFAYLGKKEYAKAISDFSKAIELDKNDADSYKDRGKASYAMAESNSQLDAAIRDFTSTIELEPKDAEAYKFRGIAYFTRMNFPNALADFEKALSIDSRDTDIYFHLAEAYTESGNFDKAAESFTKLISLKPNDTALYYKRAFIYLRQKKNDLALNDLAKVIEIDPMKEGANGIRGEILLDNKNYDEAIIAFTKEIGLRNNKQAYYYLQRGKVYRSLKKNDEALADFSKVIELDPKFDIAYEERGSIFLEMKNYDKSIEDSTKSIAINPKSKKAYEIRALSLYGKNGPTDLQAAEDYKKHSALMIESSNRIIQTDSQNISAYLDRAKAYFSTSQYQSSISDFTKVIELDPKNYTAFYWRGMLRSLMFFTSDGFKANPLGSEPVGDVQQSIQDLTKAIEIEPDKDEAYFLRASKYYYLAYVNKVDILVNRDKAIGDYAKVIKLNPKNVEAYNQISKFIAELKKVDAALNVLSDAVNANPDNPNAYFNRALFFQYTVKDKNKALVDFEKCVQLSQEVAVSYLKKICSDSLTTLKK